MDEATPAMTVAKPRRGRKPTRESRSDEIRQRIAEWKLTPKQKRQPRTLSELARELGIRESLASYYAGRIPDSLDDLLDRIPAIALLHLSPSILTKILDRMHERIKRGDYRLAFRFLKETGFFDRCRAGP